MTDNLIKNERAKQKRKQRIEWKEKKILITNAII